MVVASCDGGNLFKIAETLNNNVFAACEHVFFLSAVRFCVVLRAKQYYISLAVLNILFG
jgi:hypothetical protein